MFHKHGKCFGVPILNLGKYYIELWYCKAGYSVEEHFHQMQDNKIIFLFGNRVTFYKRYIPIPELSMRLSFRDIFRSFTIEHGCYHRFINEGKWPFIFINVARFLDNFNPVSASEDFKQII